MKFWKKNEYLVICLCIFWYFVSSMNNIVGKVTLNMFPYPASVTAIQLLSIFIYLHPVLKFLKVSPQNVTFDKFYYLKIIIPLAFGKCAASVSSHISLWKVPVSYTQTVKSTLPLFVVFLSRIINQEKHTRQIYLSLIPIVFGVTVATITELSFDIIGLSFALLSTFVYALNNIYAKKVLKDIPSLHHLSLLLILSKFSLLFLTPIWVYSDFSSILKYEDSINQEIIGFLILDGFLTFLQNLIAFTILSLVSPLTYSVCNSSKRIAIIVVSLITLKNPITIPNIFGMSFAVFGVMLYNKAKYDQNISKHKLPLYISNGQDAFNSNQKYIQSYTNGYATIL